ncbi:MAG: type II toxin-antitoxin system VapC family toxin [Methanobacteriota archaeon]
MTIFLDTGILVATNVKDPRHAETMRLLDAAAAAAWGRVFTSDFVLAEALNYVRRKVPRPSAAEDVLAIAFGTDELPPLADVLRVSTPTFAAALADYRARWDAGLSLTDWTTVAVMRERGIEHLATYDAGFGPWADVVVAPA